MPGDLFLSGFSYPQGLPKKVLLVPELVLDGIPTTGSMGCRDSSPAPEGLSADQILEARKTMKFMRWAAVLILVVFGALTHAQVPDGGWGIKGELNSIPVYTTSGGINMYNCSAIPPGAPPSVSAACTSTGAQAVFPGINYSEQGWGTLTAILTGYDQATDSSVGCTGDGFFATCTPVVTDCNAPPPNNTSCTLTLNLTQGNEAGIGCYQSMSTTENPIIPSNNAGCVTTGVKEGMYNLSNGTSYPYYNPVATYTSGVGCTENVGFGPFPAIPPGAVCGTDMFLITIGGTSNGESINFKTLPNLDFNFVASPDFVTPEPPTLFLFGAALLGIVFFASKKRILA